MCSCSFSTGSKSPCNHVNFLVFHFDCWRVSAGVSVSRATNILFASSCTVNCLVFYLEAICYIQIWFPHQLCTNTSHERVGITVWFNMAFVLKVDVITCSFECLTIYFELTLWKVLRVVPCLGVSLAGISLCIFWISLWLRYSSSGQEDNTIVWNEIWAISALAASFDMLWIV